MRWLSWSRSSERTRRPQTTTTGKLSHEPNFQSHLKAIVCDRAVGTACADAISRFMRQNRFVGQTGQCGLLHVYYAPFREIAGPQGQVSNLFHGSRAGYEEGNGRCGTDGRTCRPCRTRSANAGNADGTFGHERARPADRIHRACPTPATDWSDLRRNYKKA